MGNDNNADVANALQPQRSRPPTRREAFEAAKVVLAADGLTMSPFGLEVNERIISGEISHDQAMATLIEHHRPK